MEKMTELSIRELRACVQATAPEAGRETYVGRSIRFFSIYFTKQFARTSLTPNQLTSISVVIFLTGISLYVTQSYQVHLIGIFLVYLSIIIDACDGEIARLKGNKSGVGTIYVEPVSHDIQYAFMFIPMTYGVYATSGDAIIIYVGYIATITKLLLRFLQMRHTLVEKQIAATRPESTAEENVKGHVSILHKVYKFFNRNIFSSVGLVIPLMIFTLIDRIDLFIWFFAFGFGGIFFLNFIWQLYYIGRLSK